MIAVRALTTASRQVMALWALAGSMLASVAEVFAVYPIKSRNAAEKEAAQDSTVIFLAPESANDSSSGNPERL
jgi:hypothetical protein